MAVKVHYKCEGDTSKQKDLFEQLWNQQVPEEEQVSEHHITEFINKWAGHFEKFGDVNDEHGGVMPKKVPTQLAMEAVTLVKCGYEMYVHMPDPATRRVMSGQRGITVHKFFTSMSHAVDMVPRLKEIVQECDCTLDQLWDAMVQVDSNLVKHRVYYKWKLSDENKRKRREGARQLFDLWSNYKLSHQNYNIFYRGVYIDECRIHLGQELKRNVHVLCDKHDSRVEEIIEIPWLKPHQEITLHFIVAVNPLVGLWYISMTTGTTPPIDNSPVNRNLTSNPYQVSS